MQQLCIATCTLSPVLSLCNIVDDAGTHTFDCVGHGHLDNSIACAAIELLMMYVAGSIADGYVPCRPQAGVCRLLFCPTCGLKVPVKAPGATRSFLVHSLGHRDDGESNAVSRDTRVVLKLKLSELFARAENAIHNSHGQQWQARRVRLCKEGKEHD